MEYVLRCKYDGTVLHRRCFVLAFQILVVDLSVLIAVDLHPVRHQRVHCHHFSLAVADDLGISVPVEKEVCHQRLPEREAGHLRIGFVMEELV